MNLYSPVMIDYVGALDGKACQSLFRGVFWHVSRSCSRNTKKKKKVVKTHRSKDCVVKHEAYRTRLLSRCESTEAAGSRVQPLSGKM